jgi:glycosyltransferase involved in cell wall biosynthesis
MDTQNPNSGGSELYAFELAKRLSQDRFEVTYLTSSFKGSEPNEKLNGVRIIRMGNMMSLYPRALLWLKRHREEYDVIIEVINGPPFLAKSSKLKAKHLAIIFHLPTFVATCKKLPLLGPFEFIISRTLLRFFYRNVPIITDGESSKSELVSLHFSNVFVNEDGLEPTNADSPEIKKEDLAVITGPLKPWKKIEHGILAFSALPENWRLVIIGKGNKKYLRYLMRIINKKNLHERVKLLGYLSNIEKEKIYAWSKINIVTSEKEGFSLTAIEAARYGSVCVGYNNYGIRDAVVNERTGLLVSNNNIDGLKEAILRLAKDDKLFAEMSKNCIEFSNEFTWDNTYLRFMKILERLK